MDIDLLKTSAIFVPPAAAYGFELRQQGTMFKGTSKSKRMFLNITEGAAIVGKSIVKK